MRKTNSFEKLNKISKDNKGSVMITVLVAFLFVAVLASIILATVTVNFKMRSIDRRTKDEFYYAEKALNDLYNGIGQECSEIMGETYNDVLSKYKKSDDSTYMDEEEAYKSFKKAFVTAFYKDIALNQVDKFSAYVVKDTSKKGSSDKASRAIVKNYGTIKYYNNSSRSESYTISSESDVNIEKIGFIVIEGVKVQSNPDAKENVGYISEINTDIVVEVPRVSFFTTNNRAYDYAILANDGIELESNATVKANGNVYGGTLPFTEIADNVSSYKKAADYGGITLNDNSKFEINDAAYVVSGGDITLNGGELSINQKNTMLNNQIWFENIEVNSPSVIKVNGDLFAADDLQINSGADGATTVNIKGSYYGYNDGARQMTGEAGTKKLTTKKAIITSRNDYEKASADNDNISSRSSSIVINAKQANVDMSDLKTLLLCGNAFINHMSKDKIEPGSDIKSNRLAETPPKTDYLKLIIDAGKISDASVPESVALKMTQDIILMPTEFLKDTNPRICEAGNADPFISDAVSIPSDWFGYSYIDSAKPYTYVKLDADNSAMIYAYCYLNFKDDESKTAYVKAVIDGADTGAQPTAYDIKSEMLDRMEAYKDKLTIKVGNASTRLYANGAVLNYEGNNLTVTDPSSYTDSNAFTSYSANLYKRYRMLDTYLDSMADVPLSATDTKNIHKQDLEDDADKLPAGRFFWLWGLENAASGAGTIKAADATKAQEELKEFGSNFVYIKSSSEVDLASELTGTNPHKAFVIVDGDAKVSSDLTIQGFLVCTGKLTIKDGKKLNVTYDSTLLNKRIEKELKKLIDNGGFHDETAPGSNTQMKNLLIYYLLNEGRSFYGGGSTYKLPEKMTYDEMEKHPDYREYKFIEGTTSNSSLDLNTDYINFVYFENWKKGQR
ncbi:MAG: hypothetical protein ACI4CW_00430 [Lachnospiraceae bacterium]